MIKRTLCALAGLLLASSFALALEHIDARIRIIKLNAKIVGGYTTLVGDSHIEGFWWNQICGGWQVNAGIGGAGVDELSARIDEIMVASLPKVVPILIGINDAAYTALQSRPKETWPARYAALVNKIVAYGSTPVLLTIPPVENGPQDGAATFDPNAIRYFNEAIKNLATSRDYLHYDLYSMFVGPDGYMPAGKTVDGVHLNRDSYVQLYYVLQGALTDAWSRRGKPCSGF